MKKFNVEMKLTKKKVASIVADDSISKSERMKVLFDHGMTVKEIASHMNVRYNFVYNVISNYINMNDITIEKTVKSSKKDVIVEMFKEGKSLKEISIDTKSNYNYVFNVVKKYKQTLEDQAAAE